MVEIQEAILGEIFYNRIVLMHKSNKQNIFNLTSLSLYNGRLKGHK